MHVMAGDMAHVRLKFFGISSLDIILAQCDFEKDFN